jgi:monoamine oxidase
MKTLDADVIVVGAGIAGLAAADHLASHGKSVILAEARSRVGGRILTEFSSLRPNLPIELGAEFIHGRHPGLFNVVQNAALSLSPVSGAIFRQSNGSLQPPDDQDDSFGGVLDSPELAKRDISFAEFIRNAPLAPHQKLRVTSYVEGFNGAFADRISTQALFHQQQAESRIGGESSWRIDSGYSSLVDLFASRVRQSSKLLLETTVRGVEWGRGFVSVTAVSQNRTVRASSGALLVTVPLGVLLGRSPEAAISFSPEPPTLANLPSLDPGWALRLNFVFSEPVWADTAPDAGFILSREDRFPTWWPRQSGAGYLLTGWCGGPKAPALAGSSKEELIEMGLLTLSRLFRREKNNLRAKLESAHYHDWHGDPYSAGSYSYVTAGGFDFSQRVGLPIENTLWFAGEATACDGHWGTVHGAMDSGLRAASGILRIAKDN